MQNRINADFKRYGRIVRDERLGRRRLAERIRETEGEGAECPGTRARQLIEWMDANRGTEPPAGPSVTKQESKGSIDVEASGARTESDPRAQDLVRNVEDLIRVAEVDTDRWQVDGPATINRWPTTIAGPDGEPEVVVNWQVKARFRERVNATTLDIKIPEIMYATARSAPPTQPGPVEQALVISDPQIGFKRTRKGRYAPFHDRLALDVQLQLAAILQPRFIIWIGDNLDASEASLRWATGAAEMDTIHLAILELRYWMAAFRATCPDARIVMLEGNHGKRVRDRAVQTMAGLAEVTLPGEDRPLLSLERMLQPEDFGCEYVSPYGETFWAWDRVGFDHGDTVRAGGGKTVAATIAKSERSRVYGHVHRLELAHRTVEHPGGHRQIFHASVGCSCSTEPGVVPGVAHQRDWQQGSAIVSYDTERDTESIELIRIEKGRALWGGRALDARDHTEQIAGETGWPLS